MISLQRLVSPPKAQFNLLRQKLTPGERTVFEFFDTNLDPSWEIYLQPHLNGLRPDFVLLNPDVGIAVFEVKDWNLDSVTYWLEERQGKAPLLVGRKDGQTFSRQSDNPIEKVHRYKKELYELYCPRLQQRAGFAVITAGVIFPFADDDRVKALFRVGIEFRGMDRYPNYNPIVGRSALASGRMERVFPEGARRRSNYMSPALADDLRYWLVEPDFSATQRQALQLDPRQTELVKSRTKTGYRRIKGAAGSGKSLVLAARAAELLSEGKQILVITFNITLLHYLMDIAVRWPRTKGNTRKDITWLNFHAWCKRVCSDADCMEEYQYLWKSGHGSEHVFREGLAHLVSRIIDEDAEGNVPRYDAVLVDEGQDLLPSWWAALRKVCRPEGEMLLVADSTQDIYDSARSWTDEAMTGAGFRGDWIELPISYRLPKPMLEKAGEFAQRFLLIWFPCLTILNWRWSWTHVSCVGYKRTPQQQWAYVYPRFSVFSLRVSSIS